MQYVVSISDIRVYTYTENRVSSTSALIVVEYLDARGLLGKDGKEFSVVKSPCSSQKIKETRKELENLLQVSCCCCCFFRKTKALFVHVAIYFYLVRPWVSIY